MAFRVDPYAETPAKPRRNCLPEGGKTGGGGIPARRGDGRYQCIADELRGFVLGIADAEVDQSHALGGEFVLPGAQLGERVRTEVGNRPIEAEWRRHRRGHVRDDTRRMRLPTSTLVRIRIAICPPVTDFPGGATATRPGDDRGRHPSGAASQGSRQGGPVMPVRCHGVHAQ